MKTEMIIIGSEILSGKTREANGYWLASYLHYWGHSLDKMVVVPDVLPLLEAEIKRAWKESDVVIITGGLGPTLDDMTKKALANAFNKKIISDQKALNLAQEQYQRIGKDFSKVQNDYDTVPEGFKALANSQGLAPGLGFIDEKMSKAIFAAPGVPREFHAMFEEEIFPQLKEKLWKQSSNIKLFNIRTRFIPEEKIFFELCPNLWKDLEKFGQVASLPQVMGVDITVKFQEHTKDSYLETFSQIKSYIEKTPLKPNIWQYGTTSLPEYILALAKEKRISLGAAESCTGGLVSSRITDIPGSSDSFLGGIVSYSNKVKENVLNVQEATLKKYGAVSEQTALEMADGAKNVLNVDIAVSTTGIAGPGGGSEEKPVGTIGIGVSSKLGSKSEMFHFRGNREKLKLRFSEMALFKMLDEIEKI